MVLLSHWRRNPAQLFAYLFGLALATALWSGVQAINSEARASYGAAASTLEQGQYDLLLPKKGKSVSLEDYLALRSAGWLVSPVIDAPFGDVRLVGIDPLTSPTGFGIRQAEMNRTLQADTIFANVQTASKLPAEINITLNASIAPGVAIGDIGTVQKLLQRDDLTHLVILPQQPLTQPDIGAIAPELRIQPAELVADITALTDSFHLNLTAFGLLSFAVGLFIVHSTIGLAFEQRRSLIRSMRAMGVSLRTLIILISVEMMSLTVVGACVGIVLGYVIAAHLLPDVAATLLGLYGAEISGTLSVRADWWLSGFMLSIVGTAVTLSSRIWQIIQMPLLESARPRAWRGVWASRFRLHFIGSVMLLCAASLFAFFADGLLAGFVLLGCILIGAALALPVLASGILKFLQRHTHSPVWTWFWADTRQQLPGLSLALMALLLAVSANIGVSTMVSSFRLTFTGFLDQRLAPELYVQISGAKQSALLEAYLNARQIEVLPLLTMSSTILGQPVDLYGVRVGPTYRDNWVFLDATSKAWDNVERGQAVVVNEQLARRSDIWVGDIIQITPTLALPIAAVVGDYGNPQGQVIFSETLFQSIHTDFYPERFGIRTPNSAALRAQLMDTLGLDTSAFTNSAAIKAFAQKIFERTFVVTSALNLLTLGVAGFAILMSLLTLADLRVPQLAPVWALGITRRHLGRMELLRAILLAVFVVICAVPTGLTLAWILLTVINVEAFGWQLPMFLFPEEYARFGLYALIAAFLSAAWPALRLMQVPPSVLLGVFASER